MTRRVVHHDSPEHLATAVAGLLLERLAEVQGRGEVPQVALTGGGIADALHRELARLSPGSGVDWRRVGVWWGDERFVAGDSPDRNAGQAREALLSVVDVDPGRVHEMPSATEVATAEESARAYADALAAEGVGALDVLMLGIGPDGHLASLFPGHPAARTTDADTVAVHDSPKPPPDRVSLTFPALNRARSVWFLASGDGKADAVARALSLTEEGPLTRAEPGEPLPEDVLACPAAGVHGTVETVWHLDPTTR